MKEHLITILQTVIFRSMIFRNHLVGRWKQGLLMPYFHEPHSFSSNTRREVG